MSRTPRSPLHRKPPRRGAATLLFLLFLGVFLAALALAVDGASLWSARQELQVAADAAALAAVQTLADDAALAVPPGRMALVVEQARKAAIRVGLNNPVAGLPHAFDASVANRPSGDLVVGFLDDSRSGSFSPAGADDLDSPLLNAFFVRAERSKERGNPLALFFGRVSGAQGADLRAEALACLDRDVVGFRPQGRLGAPLAPLALFSDPSRRHPASWEAQTQAGGQDRFVFDKSERRFREVGSEAPAGDGLFEMTARLPLAQADFADAEAQEQPNAALLILGQPALRPRQLQAGVCRDDLDGLGGQLLLAWDDRLPVPGEMHAPGASDPELKKLLAALELLAATGEPRAWPLHQALQPGGEGQPPSVVVSGFVAARLAAVRLRSDPYPHLELILQPCQLMTHAALTERRPSSPLMGNPYVSKPKLVR